MAALHERLRDELSLAQAQQADSANTHRQFKAYEVGDKVYVNTRNIRTTRPSKKLDLKFIGPYTITEQINSVTYRLGLPEDLKIHNTFHCSLLQPAPTPVEGQVDPPPPPVEVTQDQETHEEYEVKAILDSKLKGRKDRKRQLLYLVKWVGYNDTSWEPQTNVLHGAESAIQAFHEQHPDKPAPLSAPRPSSAALVLSSASIDDLNDDLAFAVAYHQLQGTSAVKGGGNVTSHPHCLPTCASGVAASGTCMTPWGIKPLLP